MEMTGDKSPVFKFTDSLLLCMGQIRTMFSTQICPMSKFGFCKLDECPPNFFSKRGKY